jgi:hypothetical protein
MKPNTIQFPTPGPPPERPRLPRRPDTDRLRFTYPSVPSLSYWTVDAVKSALAQHDWGMFWYSGLLEDQVERNPRFAAIEHRAAGPAVVDSDLWCGWGWLWAGGLRAHRSGRRWGRVEVKRCLPLLVKQCLEFPTNGICLAAASNATLDKHSKRCFMIGTWTTKHC